MNCGRSPRWTRCSFAALIFAAFGCSKGPTNPPQTGNVVGSVRDAGSQSLIAGANVSIGAVHATTAPNGQYVMDNLPVGTATISVSAAGFDSYTASLTIQNGSNQHDVALNSKTIYERGRLVGYLPRSVTNYRAVFVLLSGSNGDSRPFIRGEPSCWGFQGGTPCPTDPDFRSRLLALAERYGLAVIGARTMPANDITAYDEIISGISGIAGQSGHLELANAPILLVGSSFGGCIAHGFARVHSARVIGFMSAKGNCHTGGPSPAATVPGYLFVSDEDPISPGARAAITQLFRENRPNGALWALALEVGSGHEFPRKNDQTFAWMDLVLTLRLPEAAGQPLRVLDETAGWAANNGTFAVAPVACYSGDRGEASWLPNESTARDWQTISGYTGPVGCN
jgi:hypothetical protein